MVQARWAQVHGTDASHDLLEITMPHTHAPYLRALFHGGVGAQVARCTLHRIVGHQLRADHLLHERLDEFPVAKVWLTVEARTALAQCAERQHVRKIQVRDGAGLIAQPASVLGAPFLGRSHVG